MAGGFCGVIPARLLIMADARRRRLDFAAEMLGGLARKDQRAAGELYVRGW